MLLVEVVQRGDRRCAPLKLDCEALIQYTKLRPCSCVVQRVQLCISCDAAVQYTQRSCATLMNGRECVVFNSCVISEEKTIGTCALVKT